ncbi:MAG: phasin family protein [Gammaproteobacteria bacterium]|nr:phasin family protein [Gammaproteobacteria bacterium]
MSHDVFSQFSNARQVSYESLRELGEINARAIRKLTEIQLALANLGIDGTLKQTRLLTGQNSYGELVAAQSRLASEYGSRLMEISSDAADVLVESREAFIVWAKRSFGRVEKEPKPSAKSTPRTTARRSSNRKAA